MDNIHQTQQARLLLFTLLPSLLSGFFGFYYGKDAGAQEAIRNVNTTVYNVQLYANSTKEPTITVIPSQHFNDSIVDIKNDVSKMRNEIRRSLGDLEKNRDKLPICQPKIEEIPPTREILPEQPDFLRDNIFPVLSAFLSITLPTLMLKYCGGSKDTALLNTTLVRLAERLDRDEELRQILPRQRSYQHGESQLKAPDVVVQDGPIERLPKKKTSKTRLLYSFSAECSPLKDMISSHLQRAFKQYPKFDLIHIKDASKMEECDDLLLHFEMVDDRIRLVEAKTEYARKLQQKTHNNCVWVFICFKPTNKEEGTKITNSIKDFPSGYTTADGEYYTSYLTFEYYVRSAEKDKQGNFKHVLADADQFEQKISEFVQQANV